MTNCLNESMRDLLPLMAHDALEGEELAAVQAHVASCASCAAEWRTITVAAALFVAATPQVDIAAIVAKLPAAPAARRALKVESVVTRSRPRFRFPRYALAAAASLMLTVTLSLTVLRPIFFGVAPTVDVARVDSGAVDIAVQPVALLGAEPVSSVGGTELKDLGVDELTQLLSELDQMEATIAAEPRTMREPITTESEGL